MRLDGTGMLAFCNYPMYDFVSKPDGATWRVGGHPGGTCLLRVIPSDPNAPPRSISASVRAGSVSVPVHGKLSAEGHALFALRGGQTVEIRCEETVQSVDDSVVVGAMATQDE